MNIGKKLVSLNLALVFLIGLGFAGTTAFALDDEQQDNQNLYIPVQGVCVDGVNENSELNTNSLNLDVSLTATTPYLITVGGTSFYSNTDAFGTGWSYSSSSGELGLSDYSGSQITALGNLAIHTSGDVNVTGSSGTYGSAAISVSGLLTLSVSSGTTTLTGGVGSESGGQGINAGYLLVFSDDSNANFVCNGGYGTFYGGTAIYCDRIYYYPKHSTITGGASAGTAGYGIVYGGMLYIDAVYLTLQAGSTSQYAFASTTTTNSFFVSEYVNISNTGRYQLVFSPKVFTLTLSGNGGYYNSSSSVSIPGPYPTYTNLGDYIFTRAGYKQIGWDNITSATNLIADGSVYIPTTDTNFSARWVDVQDNTVLFIGNGGTFSGAYYSKATTGSSVNIPSRTDASSPNLYLLGWTDNLNVTADSNNLLNAVNKWYLPGTVSNISSQSTLYAEWTSVGNVICYYGNGGYTVSGSEAVVQAKLSSSSNLQLYVQNDLGFTKSGYTFTGWEDGDGKQFSAGQIVSSASNLTVTNLIAQWKKTYTLTLNGNGGQFNGSATEAVSSYEGNVENLSNYAFTNSGCTLTGWNTKQNGSGAYYPKDYSQTMNGDITLYAQWIEQGSTYNSKSTDLKDTMSCLVASSTNKVNITIGVTSQINSGQNSVTLPVCYALYQGGRLIGVYSKNVQLTGTGMIDNALIYYSGTVKPTSCKVFILNNTSFAPVGPPITCSVG